MLHTKYREWASGFLSFSPLEVCGGYITLDCSQLELRDLIGRIYVGDNKTLLHTKYISCGPHGFREKIFLKVFPIISLWKLYVVIATRVAQKPYASLH